MKERLGDELADYYLDRDPTNVPDPNAAARRAQLVLDIDPDNIKARDFLLRFHTYLTSTRMKEGARNFVELYKELDDIRRHAVWLEAKLPDLSAERQAELKSDLASYYGQMGEVKHEEGQKSTSVGNEATERLNRAIDAFKLIGGSASSIHVQPVLNALIDRKSALDRTRASYRAADSELETALRFERMIPRATQLIERHRQQYEMLSELLNQTKDLLRQLRGH
jgi:hypothetical protein